LRQTLRGLPDCRTGDNLSYTMEDIGSGAFGVFFTQCPSFLAHQKTMQQAKGRSNAQSLFQLKEIPSDNLRITEQNGADIVAAGRARWKIENENNNTLKTKGYHLEHNFGHGKKHLASLLAAMNILAFLYHTFLSFTAERYRLIRAALPTRKTFFDDLRALTRYLLFANWDALLDFMLRGLEIGPYAQPP